MTRKQMRSLLPLVEAAVGTGDTNVGYTNPNVREKDLGDYTYLTSFNFDSENAHHTVVMDADGQVVHTTERPSYHW